MTAALVVMAMGDGEVWVLGAAGGQEGENVSPWTHQKGRKLWTHLD